MTLICFASQKGSPGTSAAALAVAAALRPGDGRRKLLLEADAAGGALAIRYRLPTEPGLITLAAAARAGLTDDELWRHVGELPGGLPAVLCPDGPEQVHSALAAAGAILGRHLAERRDIDVICDLGRLAPGSPAVELAAEATALLMVARPTAEQLQPAARRMLALRPKIKNLGWLLVGDKPHGPAEVESTFGFPVVGVLADDARSVEAIEGGAVTRRVRRHPFVRSAATVASTLTDWLAPLATAPLPDSSEHDQASAPLADSAPQPPPARIDTGASAAPPPTPTHGDPPGGQLAEPSSLPTEPASATGPPSAVPLSALPPPCSPPSDRPSPSPAAGAAASPVPPVGADPLSPAVPMPSAGPGGEVPEVPDPFVHGDGDVEWTGT